MIPQPPPPPPGKPTPGARVQVTKTLRLRAAEHLDEADAALDCGDLVKFQDKRSLSRLEQNAADEVEAEED